MHLIAGGFDPEDVARILKTVRDEYGDKITPEQANKLAVFRLLGQRKDAREYRVEATRSIIGGKKGNKVKLGGIDNEEIVRREIALAKAKGVNAGRATSFLT